MLVIIEKLLILQVFIDQYFTFCLPEDFCLCKVCYIRCCRFLFFFYELSIFTFLVFNLAWELIVCFEIYIYLFLFCFLYPCRFTYEIAPVFVLMEQITLRKMREIIGWSNKDGDGIFSPGGFFSCFCWFTKT